MNHRYFRFARIQVIAAIVFGMGASMVTGPAAVAQDRPVASRPQVTTPTIPPATPAATHPATPPTTAPATTAPAKVYPAASDIIAASIEAIGGKKAVDEIMNIHIKAGLVTPVGKFELEVKSSPKGPFIVARDRPDEGTTFMGFDGTVSWKILNSDSMLLDDDQISDTKDYANTLCYWYLLRPQDKFKHMTTVAQLSFNQQDCYKVRFSDKPVGGHELFGFYSVASKIMQGIEISQQSPTGESFSINFIFDDWKKVGDVTLFHNASAGKEGGNATQRAVFTYTDVEVNKLDDKAFEQPKVIKDLVAKKNGTATTQPTTQPATQPAKPPATMPQGPATKPAHP